MGSRQPAPTHAPVLVEVRAATAAAHQRTEDLLALTSPTLTPHRLAMVVSALGAFWVSAELGLDAWASNSPAMAERLLWPQRRRSRHFLDDVRALGGTCADLPSLPDVDTTGQALGRLYVLEGSTLGGQMINEALAARTDSLSCVQLRGLSPYGTGTGAMWHGYREVVGSWPGDPGEIIASAVQTFAALEVWVAPLGEVG